MTKGPLALAVAALTVVSACGDGPRPRTVEEFLDDPIGLEAAVVRCSQNRETLRYDAECVNARQAVSIIEAKEDRARAKELEQQSERKREALRRTQQAAAEARRRAQEAERMRREAEYLAQFGESPPPGGVPIPSDGELGNAPGMVLPEAPADEFGTPQQSNPAPVAPSPTTPPPAAPTADPVIDDAPPAEAEAPADLNAIREELQRRNEPTSN